MLSIAHLLCKYNGLCSKGVIRRYMKQKEPTGRLALFVVFGYGLVSIDRERVKTHQTQGVVYTVCSQKTM